MGSIEFEDENFLNKPRGSKPSFIISFLTKTGMVKNERQASIILVVFVIVAISATIFILLGRNAEKEAYVTDNDGNRYQMEEYIQLVKQGKDPLRK